MLIKDQTIIKTCLTILTIGILALGILTNKIDTENPAIIQKINQNGRFLNLTILLNNSVYEATAYTKEPLNIEQGDYIKLKGTIKNNQIAITKLVKLKLY